MMDRADKKRLLAKAIEAAIFYCGLKKQDFAKLMNVQPSIVTRWLSGNHNFTLETLLSIEYVLGIRLVDVEKPVRTSIRYSMKVDKNNKTFSTQVA